MKILTNYRINMCPLWHNNVTYLQDLRKNPTEPRNKFLKLWNDLICAFAYFRLSKGYDVIITYKDRPSFIFSLLQSVSFRKKEKHIMLNLLWDLPKNRFSRSVKKFTLHLSLKNLSRVVVFATHEIKDYKTNFNLPEEKFTYVPYYFTPVSYKLDFNEGQYIFSGGHAHYRDYETLLEVVSEIKIECFIATQVPEYFKGKVVPNNVHISHLSDEEFFRSLAGCKMVVVPLKKGYFRSTGQRTYLNAMLFNKPLIVCDDFGAHDYIKNGEEGFVVPAGNAAELKMAINRVLKGGNEIKEMIERAQKRAKQFTVENTMTGILGLAEEVTGKKYARIG